MTRSDARPSAWYKRWLNAQSSASWTPCPICSHPTSVRPAPQPAEKIRVSHRTVHRQRRRVSYRRQFDCARLPADSICWEIPTSPWPSLHSWASALPTALAQCLWVEDPRVLVFRSRVGRCSDVSVRDGLNVNIHGCQAATTATTRLSNSRTNFSLRYWALMRTVMCSSRLTLSQIQHWLTARSSNAQTI